tara:strand:+ start:440 stop:1036 length:597 start_codon:yes stop_codon:yes gene_type:complete
MELVRYDAMVTAIQVCERVDEVKDIRDKAVALEAYAKQANNMEAERQCALIRVRAERKCGQMLRDTEKATGNQHVNSAQSDDSTKQIKTLSDMGITKDQSSTWQKLANVPEDEFEAAITMPGTKPSASHIIATPEPEPKRMDKNALYIWGELSRMDKMGLFDVSLNSLVYEWTHGMKSNEALSLIPKLKEWVNNYVEK